MVMIQPMFQCLDSDFKKDSVDQCDRKRGVNGYNGRCLSVRVMISKLLNDVNECTLTEALPVTIIVVDGYLSVIYAEEH